jgi:hypothetical protein
MTPDSKESVRIQNRDHTVLSEIVPVSWLQLVTRDQIESECRGFSGVRWVVADRRAPLVCAGLSMVCQSRLHLHFEPMNCGEYPVE